MPDQAPTPPVPPKRGRGRPRKVPLNVSQSNDNIDDGPSGNGAPISTPVADTALPNTRGKRSRGRPQKAPPTASQNKDNTDGPSGNGAPDSNLVADTAIPNPMEKRGRKRAPPKNANTDDLPAAKKNAQDLSTTKPEATEPPKAEKEAVDPCPICLEEPLHPIALPCSHTFCFLCAKGLCESTLTNVGTCSLCRQSFPRDLFRHPQLRGASTSSGNDASVASGTCWYYEGRSGWWKFDERNGQEIEDAYCKKLEKFEMLICGSLYMIDFKNMIQYRKDGTGRVRVIKRDLASAHAKGVAGLAFQ